MGFGKRDGDSGETAGVVTQTTRPRTIGEPIGDHFGEELGRGVPPGEGRFLVQVAVVEFAEDGAEFVSGPCNVDNDVVGVQLRTTEGGVHEERSPVQSLRRPEDLAVETVRDHDVIANGDAEQDTPP